MMLKHDELKAEFAKLGAAIEADDEKAALDSVLAIGASLAFAVHTAALSLQLISHNSEKDG